MQKPLAKTIRQRNQHCGLGAAELRPTIIDYWSVPIVNHVRFIIQPPRARIIQFIFQPTPLSAISIPCTGYRKWHCGTRSFKLFITLSHNCPSPLVGTIWSYKRLLRGCSVQFLIQLVGCWIFFTCRCLKSNFLRKHVWPLASRWHFGNYFQTASNSVINCSAFDSRIFLPNAGSGKPFHHKVGTNNRSPSERISNYCTADKF